MQAVLRKGADLSKEVLAIVDAEGKKLAELTVSVSALAALQAL